MKIVINGTPEEIAALVVEIQKRQCIKVKTGGVKLNTMEKEIKRAKDMLGINHR